MGSNRDKIDSYLKEFAKLHESFHNCTQISPQLFRRLQLITSKSIESCTLHDIASKVSSFFTRLLLELVHLHYNTRQREQDAIRLINVKGCTVIEPELTDAVIDHLVKLYKAANQCSDTSFERSVLVEFLSKQLDGDRIEKRVGKVIQTLYRSSCFEVIKKDGFPAGLKLKDGLTNACDLRRKHDSEIIRLVQENHIRLTPESWAYILYKSSKPETLSAMQSLLDKEQNPIKVEELVLAISTVGDKYNIEMTISELIKIETLLEEISKIRDDVRVESLVCELLYKLLQLKDLFSLRQNRKKALYQK